MSSIQQSLLSNYAPASGGSPITLIAHGSNTSADNTNAAISAIDTTGATLLVLVLVDLSSAGSVFPPVDSKSNTWVNLSSYGVTLNRVTMWYVKNPVVGSGHTFTFSHASYFPSMCVVAVNNTNTAANVDQQNGNNGGTVATIQPGSITPSQDNEILIVGWGAQLTAAPTIDSGFTVLENAAAIGSGGFQSALAYKIQTAAGAENPTLSFAAQIACAAIASFKHS